MATPATPSPAADPAASGLLEAAARPETTPFDFIIVGSGAGGGPLAARLALGGKRVLLLEAGHDPAKQASREFPAAQPGEVHNIPGYHAAATEDAEASWQFSVRHFEDAAGQRQDHKYDPRRDPSSPEHNPSLPGSPRPGPGAGGLFYPRSAGLGGCTGHHAMIVAAPNDRDWERIADLTGDDSWRAEKMRSYFTKLENCRYLSTYYSRLDRLLGPLIRWWRWVVHVVMPRHILDQGGHGNDGWQPTAFISPLLIETIAKRDHTFLRLLRKAVTAVVFKDRPLLRRWRDALFQFRLLRQFDPNDRNTRHAGEKGVFLIPTGIGGEGDTDEENRPMVGRRAGVREFLLKTARDHPDRLVIQTGFHVARLAFAEGSGQATPEVIGVIGFTGSHLYDASPLRPEIRPDPSVETAYYARSEVILCGGAFNTPQLLMLSGIGPKVELERHGIPCRVDLPGVGRNLQDRYEVAVISELAQEFKTLRGVSFTPGDPNDPARTEWLRDGTGLYATNGGTLAITLRTAAADSPEPDIFAFGAPAAFRGYYWGWSRELLARTKGAAAGPPRLWSWIILKAYTHNDSGTVTLRSASPLDTPEIDFRSFQASASDPSGPEKDLSALEEAVEMVRRVNHCNPELFQTEIQPGPDRAQQSQSLREWIHREAWGHHACGTCRMGSDEWRPDPAGRHDQLAVLDSSFRVQGVRRLRVVDASIFPQIPGYFILTPILMASEKAADVILEGAYESVYPRALESAERNAVARRRLAARLPESQPATTLGLALSGGGVRCATFSLGVIQSLARLNRLREIDYLSTVSGGGFTGAFLGRLFTRPVVVAAADPVGRVQGILSSSGSGQVGWLRSRANYIFSSGSDSKANAGILWRNLFTVHVLIGILLLSLLGILAWISKVSGFQRSIALPVLNGSLPAIQLSFWWWVPGALLVGLLLPLTLGYWLAPKQNAHRAHPPLPFAAWLLLLFASTVSLAFPATRGLGTIGLLMLGVAWVAQEFSRWYLPARGPVERAGVTVRNRLSRVLGDALVLFGASLGWVILDSLARTIADPTTAWRLVQALIVLAPVLIMLRNRTEHLLVRLKNAKGGGLVAALTAVLLGAFVVLVVDVVSHALFQSDPVKGLIVVGTALVISLVLGRESDLLNLTSLHTAYAARLIRTYLGSSNPDRIHRITTQDASPDVQQTHPDDDVAWHQYRPELTGGPLHLINVCVNETVDAASQLEVPDRRGMAMCIGPVGVSVGRRFHSLWAKPSPPPAWQRRRCWIEGRQPDNGNAPTGLDPIVPRKGEFHVLQRQSSREAMAAGFDHDVPLPERLTLGTWMAISGSAFSTGVGRQTTFAQSLAMGFVNLRLGYWWNSSIAYHERPGKYPDHLWRRIKRIPVTIFRMQMLLLSEWIGRYHGPNRLLWHLSDGGHFEVTGAYELIRRRVGLIFCVDGAADPNYAWESLAVLGRTVRQDFGAEMDWLDPADAEGMNDVPAWVFERVARSALGSLDTIGRNGQGHAALARIQHREGEVTWLVVIKPSLVGGEPRDVVQYAEDSAAFPQEPTIDQVFEDAQWESYRALGQTIAARVFLPPPSRHA